MFYTREIDNWDNKFLLEAVFWSRSSHDEQTKCGCALVKDKTILSTGYNGFIRGANDDELPKVRPEKYPFMIHAEANAIYNCTRLGRSTLGSIAYVTGIPCGTCLQIMHQAGVEEIVFTDVSDPKMVIGDADYHKIMKMVQMRMYYVPASKLDQSHFVEASLEIAKRTI